jgi:aminotransferase
MKDLYSNLLDQIPPSGIRSFFDLVIDSKDIISLGVGEPDFKTPSVIVKQAIKILEKGKNSYTSNYGLLSLREEISIYQKNRFGCFYNPEDEVLITAGVSEGVDLCLRSILNAGDEVILPEPNYVCYAPLITLNAAKIVKLDTSKTGFIPDPALIKKSITSKTKAIVLCSPNNPTGVVIPKEVLKEIAKLAEENNFWVIADEIYAEITFDASYVSFSSLPNVKDRTILLNGFSKSFAMTGWRLGYVCGPQALISRMVKILQYAQLCAPTLSQYAAITALKNAIPDVEQMKKSYKSRRNLCVNRFMEMGLDIVKPDGAMYCFPSIQKTGLTSLQFALKLLEEEKVAVVPGDAFGESGEGFVRCCYATDRELLIEALNRMESFVKRHTNSN